MGWSSGRCSRWRSGSARSSKVNISRASMVHENNPASLGLEVEVHPAQIAQGARDRLVLFRRGLEHEEAARARAEKLAAARPGFARFGVPMVNPPGGDAPGESLLEQPSFVNDVAQ